MPSIESTEVSDSNPADATECSPSSSSRRNSADWALDTNTRLQNSNQFFQDTNNFRKQSKRNANRMEDHANATHATVNALFQRKVRETTRLSTELRQHAANLKNCINQLEQAKADSRHFLETFMGHAADVVASRMHRRAYRRKTDSFEDITARALRAEQQNVANCQTEMNDLCNVIDWLIDKMTECLNEVETDAYSKENSTNLDQHCLQLRSLPPIPRYRLPNPIPIGRKFSDMINPLTEDETAWQTYTEDLLQRAINYEEEARSLANQTAEEIERQRSQAQFLADETAKAFQSKQYQTTRMVMQLSNQSRGLTNELNGLEAQIEQLKKEISETEYSLSLLMAQFQLRDQNTLHEKMYHDALHVNLRGEYEELTDRLNTLKTNLMDSLNRKAETERMLKDVRTDMQGKSMNLRIDLACCNPPENGPAFSPDLVRRTMFKPCHYRPPPSSTFYWDENEKQRMTLKSLFPSVTQEQSLILFPTIKKKSKAQNRSRTIS